MVNACILAVCSFTYRFLLPNGTPNLVNLLIADLHNTTFIFSNSAVTYHCDCFIRKY